MGRRTAPSSVSASAAVALILLSTAASALVVPAPSRGRPSVGGPAGATIAGSLDGGYARRRWPRLFSTVANGGGADVPVATTESPGGASAPPKQTHYDTVVVGELVCLSFRPLLRAGRPRAPRLLADFLTIFFETNGNRFSTLYFARLTHETHITSVTVQGEAPRGS